MNLEQMKARVADIAKSLKSYDALENFSTEDVETINTLSAEFKKLQGDIEAKETLEAMNATLNKPVAKVKKVERVPYTPSKLENNMGFANLGDFSKAIVGKSKGNLDKRFQNSAAYEKFAEDGGVLIPEDFMTEISEKTQGDESLLPRTTDIKISGNSLSLPVDEKEPWNGGVKAYWLGEGAQYTESKQVLKQAHWRLHKLGALVKATDELLEDAVALESYIKRKAPNAIMHKINDAIINGDGVAKPFGILNSGFTKSVDKESAQPADTIVFKNIIKMEASLIPSPNAVWLCHPQCKEQLRQLKDDNGNAVYMGGGQFPSLAGPGFDTLMGKPVIYMMGAMQALGDNGDIILADLSYYHTIRKTEGVKQFMSTHLLFDYDITSFKFITRVDGSCPYTAPITTENGSYEMSGFVSLAARA